jgi:arylsulfatase A-like enzyme
MSREQPNILLIFTDQHRLSAVGCYGDTPCRTPHIDDLAQEGIRFENAYTACPLCSPARATIMTGLYPHTHGVCQNVHDLGTSIHELSDRPDLLSRQLGKGGYSCGYTGKWHLGSEEDEAFGFRQRSSMPRDVGFEGHNCVGGGINTPEFREYLSDRGLEYNVVQSRDVDVDLYGPLSGIVEGPTEATLPYHLADHTIGLIDEFSRRSRPFFVWHNFWGPHIPYHCSREYYDLYRNVDIPEWPDYRWPAASIPGYHQLKIHPRAWEAGWDDWAEVVRCYYGLTSLIDAQVGRIMAHLDTIGERENTVVIFTADHGQTLGSHGGLTDKGFHHFEEIQRIPLIVSAPHLVSETGGQRSGVRRELIQQTDVYPTILDYAGLGPPAGRHGRSFAPLVAGEEIQWRDEAFVEFHGLGSVSATSVTVRHGSFKYGWNATADDELYDLASDPNELVNQIHNPKFADVVLEMRERIEGWMDKTGHPALSAFRMGPMQHHILRGWGDS